VRYGLRKILEQQSGWGVIAEAGEATRHIRAGLRNTEVLLFTVHEDVEVIRECLKARSRLLKATTESQLLSAIEFLAVRKPVFTGKIAETLLNSFLAISTAGVAHVISIRRDLPTLARERLGQRNAVSCNWQPKVTRANASQKTSIGI